MARTVELTILNMSGDALAQRSVPEGHTAGSLRQDLAKTFGIPCTATKLLQGSLELADDQFFTEEALLTCVFMAAPPSSLHALLEAAGASLHGYVRAMLQASRERQQLLLGRDKAGCSAFEKAAAAPEGLGVMEVLVLAAKEAGILEECLTQGDGSGRTVLHHAVEASAEKVQLLLSAGRASLWLLADGTSVMHSAAAAGRAEVAAVLHAAAREEGRLRELLTLRDGCGRAALHCAALHGHLEFAAELMAAARQEEMLPQLLVMTDYSGHSVLHCAARDGHSEMAELLVAVAKQEGVLARLLTLGDCPGQAALHYAAHRGHWRVAEVLMATARSEGVLNRLLGEV